MNKRFYQKHSLCILLSMYFGVIKLLATDYYVASNVVSGNGAGTSADPWELMYAINNIDSKMGHSIILKKGTYTVSFPIDIPLGISLKGEGSDASSIVITANNDLGSEALIRMEVDNETVTSNYDPSFDGNQEISNFTIYGNDYIKTGLSVIGRNNVKLKNIRVIDFALSGIVFSGAPGNSDSLTTKISGSEIAYCYIENSAGVANRQNSYYSGNIEFGGWSDGSIHHNTVIDYAALNEGGIGIKSRNGGFSWNVEVHHNFIICSPSAYRWGSQFTIEFNKPWGNMQFYNNILQNGGTSLTRGPDGYRTIAGKPNLIIRDNIFYKATQPIELYTEYTEVYGNYLEDCDGSFAVAHTAAMKNMTFHHNTLIDCSTGIYMKNAAEAISENILFYNNLLKGVSSPFLASNGQSNDIDVQNNIFQDCGTIWSSSDGNLMSNVSFDYNLFQNTTQLSNEISPDFGSNNIYDTDPGLNLSGYLYTTYYSPSSVSSVVVDAGNDLGDITSGYQGTAPDIGAFEFGVSPTSVTGVSMPLEIAMYPGDVKRLYAFIEPWKATPASTITWSTTDNSPASLDRDGYVTANALGNAYIVVDVDGFKDSTLVRVVHVDIDSLQITSSAVTLKKNDNITVSLLFYPRHSTDRTVSWSSKDNTIASASGGTIIGNASGETYVYATSNENSFKDSVKIIVSTDKLPMAWWKFNNSNVNVIDDSWPAILKNGTRYSTESKEGSHSIEMTGSNEQINIANENIRVATSKRTVMLWIKFRSFTDSMNLYEEGGSKGGLVLRMDPDKKLKYRVMDNYVYGDIIVDYSFENQWTHVAAVLDNNQMRLYLNGQEAGAKTLAFSGMGEHTNGGGIGYRNGADPFGENMNRLNLAIDGYIDDVQIYNVVMSEKEIKAYLADFDLECQ